MGPPQRIELMTHHTMSRYSTRELHFVPTNKTFKNSGGKEGNVLFNDALNTFYLWLYGIRHMVKDHSDSERGKPPSPHGLYFILIHI